MMTGYRGWNPEEGLSTGSTLSSESRNSQKGGAKFMILSIRDGGSGGTPGESMVTDWLYR